MARRLTTEDHLARLRQWRAQPASVAALAELHALLESKRIHGLVLKRAAELALQWRATSLIHPLRDAALALAVPPENAKRDPGCEGKTEVLRTLLELDAAEPAFYLAASLWIQVEPGMDRSKDFAAECRGLAAIGIAQTRPANAITRLVDLLADPEILTRQNAALALGVWRGLESVPLLRLKARLGDESADVMAEVFGALLRQDVRENIPFLITFLESADPPIIEAAAIALAQSHSDDALKPLTEAFNRYQKHAIHTSLLMSLALLRTDASVQWFLDQLPKSASTLTAALLDALRIYRGDSRTTARICAAIESRPQALEVFAGIFPQN